MRSKNLLKKISTILLIVLIIFGMLFTSLVYTFASVPSNTAGSSTSISQESSDVNISDGDSTEAEENTSKEERSSEEADKSDKEETTEAENTGESSEKASSGENKESSPEVTEEGESEDKVTKTDINAFDPYYFSKHLSDKYVKADSFDLSCFTYPVSVARGVATYNQDKQSEFKVTENFIAGIEYRIAIYDVDEDSDYYVAKPDVNIGNEDYQIYDVYCGYNNDQGEKVNAIYEDGILYIPKKAIDKPSNEYGLNEDGITLAIQTSYYLKGGINTEDDQASYSKDIPIQITGEDSSGNAKTNKNTITVDNMFDGYLSVKNFVDDPSDYKASDFAVFLNGMLLALDEDEVTYDSDTGVISTTVSPATVSNVQIVIKEKSTLSKAASKVKSAILPDVSAASVPAATNQAGMKYYKNPNGKTATLKFDTAKIFIGWRGYQSTKYLYSGSDGIGKNPETGNASDNRYDKLLSSTGGKSGTWYNSIKYMYGGSNMNSMWALTSYTSGINRGSNGDKIAKASTQIKHDGKKKTAYEWLLAYRNKVQQPRQVVGGATKPKYGGNGLGGLTNFAFKFKTSYTGSKLNLVSGKTNGNITFDTEYIKNNTWLSATCTHLAAGEGGSDNVKDSKALYVSCIGLTDDYVVLCFTNAVALGKGQTCCAIYKFKINDYRLDFNIHKTGELDGKAVSGASYTLYQKNDTKKINRVTKKTNSNGNIDFGKLANGTYYLNETVAPTGYSKDKTTYTLNVTTGKILVYNGSTLVKTITSSSTKFEVKDTELAKLEVIKAEMDNIDNKLKGAELTLVSKGEETSNYAKTVTTDDNGKAVFENLSPGTYTLSETKVPSDEYKAFDPVDIKVVKESSGYKITLAEDSEYVSVNTSGKITTSLICYDPKGGSLNIKKVKSIEGSVTDELLTGATFTLYENEFGENWDTKSPNDYTKKVQAKTTNEGKEISINGIQTGDYVLIETGIPAHYDDTVTKDLFRVQVDENGITTVTSKFPSNKYSLIDISTDSTSRKVPTITMKNEKLANLSFKKTDKKTGNALEGATFTIEGTTDANKSFSKRATSTSTGMVFFEGIPNGTYTMTETNTDENHQKLTGTFNVTVSGYKVTEFAYVEGDTTTDLSKDGTAEVSNPPQIPKIYIKKVEADNGDTTKDSASESWDTKDGLSGASFQILNSDGVVLQTVTTEDDGTAVFNVGFPDGTYTIKETKAPEGYVLDQRTKTITIKDGEISETGGINFRASKTNDAQVQFGNAKGVTFNFLKFDSSLIGMFEEAEGDSDKKSYYNNYIEKVLGVSGVTFTITKSGETSPIETCVTNDKGMTTFKNALEDGTYIIRETEVPENVIQSDITITVVVKNNTIESAIDSESAELTDYAEYFEKVETIFGQKITAPYAFPNNGKGNLKILKTDAVSGSKLENATFTLTGQDDLEGYNETATTDSDGIAWFKNLNPGTYKLYESKYPDTSAVSYGGKTYWEVVVTTSDNGTTINVTEKGVVTDNTRSVSSSVSTEDATITYYDTYELSIKDLRKCKINIFKRSADDGTLLANAEYSLVSDDEDYEYSKKGTTNENGKCTFEDMIDGTYTLTETRAPAGYQLGEYVSEGTYITKWRITIKDGKVESVKALSDSDSN